MLHRGQAVFALIEHEELHQETLAYMWHRLPRKRRPAEATVLVDGAVPESRQVEIQAGRATLGAMPGETPFGWDNEFPRLQVEVPAFAIDAHNVTNQQYLEFIEAGGYTNPTRWSEPDWAWRTGAGIERPPFWFLEADGWFWRGMFELIPLPAAWPVYVSHAEASAYTRWKGLRLPTEAEWEYACRAGTENAYSYGDETESLSQHGWWAGNSRGKPEQVGQLKPNPWGFYDIHGNVFEWCLDIYKAYPEGRAYSDTGKLKILRGGAYYCPSNILRSACRAEAQKPDYRWILGGFRVVLAPPVDQVED